MPATRPRPQASTGPPRTITLDGNTYVVAPGTTLERTPLGDGPTLHHVTHRPPWGIGLRYGMEPDRVLAEENVNSLFTAVTRGPQKQSVTLPAGTVAYNRFQEARGELYAMSRRTSLLAGQTVTKLYFHNATDDRSITGLPTNFGSTPAALIQTMNPTIGTTQASRATGNSDVGITSQIVGKFASPALASQTILAQNWTLNIARGQTAALADTNTIWSLRLYAFRPATQTAVGYLVGSATTRVDYTDASENTLASTEQSLQDGVFAGSQVIVQNGDVLVCEVLVRDTLPAANTLVMTLYLDGATETTTDNTTVTSHASFLSSANNLTLSGAIPALVAGRLVYLTTSSAFTDTTIDTDLGVNYVQGISAGSQRLLALSAFPYSPTGGQTYSVLAQSWDGLVWTNTNLQVQNQFLMVDIADIGGTINILYSDDVSYPTQWRISALGSGVLTGSAPIAITVGTVVATVASSVAPLRMVSYPNSAGTEKAWVSTAEGLYMEGVLMRRWADTAGGFSGTFLESGIVRGRDSILFNDGHHLYQGYWEQGGTGAVFKAQRLGPEVDDGLPEDQQGAVTTGAYSEESEWFASGVGGEDASHQGGVFIHKPGRRAPVSEADVTDEVHRPYENATANRIIRALTFTRENNGVSKLIMMEDNGTANDVDCFMFTYILDNPLTVAAYPHNASGFVTFSQGKPKDGLQQVGFQGISVEARDLSATKYVTIQDGQDGTAPANAQTIDSALSPPQVWPDKTDATAGVGVAARSQQIILTIRDSVANTTAGPTVLEVAEGYSTKAMTPGGNTLEEYRFTVDLASSSKRGTFAGNPKNVWDALKTTAEKHTLVLLTLPGGETVYVSADVSGQFEPELQNSAQQAPALGTTLVRCRRMLR